MQSVKFADTTKFREPVDKLDGGARERPRQGEGKGQE